MSKRGQEGTSGESSPMAKPKSMNLVMAKPRSISLVPRNMSSNFSSRDMSDSESQGNVEVEPGIVRTRIWKQMANTSPYPTEHSQEWKPERTQEESHWKQERKSEGESSWKQKQLSESARPTCYWEQKQSASTYKSGKEFGTVQSPIQHYVGQVFVNLQKKLGITEGSEELGPMNTNILIWGLFMSSSMRAAIHLGQTDTENMAVFKNMRVEEIQNVFKITQRLCWKILKRS